MNKEDVMTAYITWSENFYDYQPFEYWQSLDEDTEMYHNQDYSLM
jgi:hypothetical protein